jgi:hypothetical protein
LESNAVGKKCDQDNEHNSQGKACRGPVWDKEKLLIDWKLEQGKKPKKRREGGRGVTTTLTSRYCSNLLALERSTHPWTGRTKKAEKKTANLLMIKDWINC